MTQTTVTVLGSAGSYPGPGRACSSYLLEHEGYRLLLDCGNGSMSNLLQLLAPEDLDALLVSHRHPDHFADIYGLYIALRYRFDGPRSVPVYAPAEAEEVICRLVSDTDDFAKVLPFTEVRAGDKLELGPFCVQLFRANHLVETIAARIECAGKVVAYSADSDVCADLVDCARDADLFICDATWLESDGPFPDGIHMTGLQAGRVATEAGARQLLITHVWPVHDPASVAAEAARGFGGEVLIARDLQEHRL
jgi:ribonuclease BN (tRNA processing enzyme)